MKNFRLPISVAFIFSCVTAYTQDIQATVNHATNPSTADGSINIQFLGGLSPYEIYWGGPSITTAHFNQPNISGLVAGNYTARFTDSQCGESNKSFTVESGLEPCNSVLSISKNVTQGCSYWDNSSISVSPLNGRAPYTYNWSTGASGNSYIYNLSPGFYAVTITDANGCQAVESAEIKLLTILSTDITYSCPSGGQELAVATVSATGGTPPYQYSWDYGNWVNEASQGFFPNIYYHSVRVSDANGCTAYHSFMVNPSTSFPLSISITPQYFCDNGQSLNLLPAYGGGVPPYNFNWSNGATTSFLTNVANGNYTVTITDSRGCTSVSNTEIIDDLIDFDMVIQRVVCTTADIKLTLNSNNLHPNWQYKIDDGQWSNFTNFSNIVYFATEPNSRQVSVKNEYGCILTKSIPPFAPRISTSYINWNLNYSQCSQYAYCTDSPWVILGSISKELEMNLVYNSTTTPCELVELYCSLYGIDIIGINGRLDLQDGSTFYNGIERWLGDVGNNCIWNVDCVFTHPFLGSVRVNGKGIKNCFASPQQEDSTINFNAKQKTPSDLPYKIISISPNPFSNQINFITEAALNTDVTIEIFNTLGVKIDSREIVINKGTNSNQIMIDKNFLTEGMYLFVIRDKMGGVYSRKLLHQK